MNDIPRQKLKELIQRFGTSLSEDRLRCLGMLKDLCGERKKEISGIMAALDEKIPAEILKPDFSVAITRKLLIKKLEDNRAIAPEVAEWAVDTWVTALGVITDSQIPNSFCSTQIPSATNSSVSQSENHTSHSSTPTQLDYYAELPLTTNERLNGGKKRIALLSRRIEVTIPPSIKIGTKLRLKKQGTLDPTTGAIGDLYLIVGEALKPQYEVQVTDIEELVDQLLGKSPTEARADRIPEVSADLGDGVTLELVHIPAGRFMMGSQAYQDEEPIHEVSVGEFYIGKYPITQIQYELVMGNNPSCFKGENLPVESVSWHSAQEFCRKLTVQTGQRYRLPSEAEWEYAARGGNKSGGFTYAGSNNLDEVGWYGRFGGETKSVGQKKANELGIYDMSGNVWEWCEDVWHDNYNGAPIDGSAWTVSGNQNFRVLRGGSWRSDDDMCRVAIRNRCDLLYVSYSFGFRVVASLVAM